MGAVMKKIITKYLEDILIFSGLLIIIITTFLLSKIIGLYATGIILFGLGVYFSKYPVKR
jgi:hypothetical protein